MRCKDNINGLYTVGVQFDQVQTNILISNLIDRIKAGQHADTDESVDSKSKAKHPEK